MVRVCARSSLRPSSISCERAFVSCSRCGSCVWPTWIRDVRGSVFAPPTRYQEVSVHELNDLNRGRSYLADVAWRHGCPVYQSIEAGVEEVLNRFGKRSTTPVLKQ